MKGVSSEICIYRLYRVPMHFVLFCTVNHSAAGPLPQAGSYNKFLAYFVFISVFVNRFSDTRHLISKIPTDCQ